MELNLDLNSPEKDGLNTSIKYINVPKESDATRDYLLEEIKRVAKENPDKNISRDFFRQKSKVKESDWTYHFGTFNEFKRATGLTPSRVQSLIFNNTAKHSSKDYLKNLNVEKRNYEDKYIRSSTSNEQSIVVGTDIHDLHCDLFYRRLFIDTVKRILPEYVVIGGDLFDFPEFSRFSNDPRNYNILERIKWVHDFLEDIRNASPNSTVYLIAGNHEERLIRYLGENCSPLVTILEDLHNMSISKILGLDKFEINYISRLDLKAFTDKDFNNELRKNYLIINESVLIHHFSEGFSYGLPGCHGHSHKHLVRNGYSHIFGSYDWHQLGSGHKRYASYCSGEKWNNGFIVIHNSLRSKRTAFEYIDCTNDIAVIGGKFYWRNEEEMKSFI
jgi:hypothetical protein